MTNHPNHKNNKIRSRNGKHLSIMELASLLNIFLGILILNEKDKILN